MLYERRHGRRRTSPPSSGYACLSCTASRPNWQKQVEFKSDNAFCGTVDEAAEEWGEGLEGATGAAEEVMEDFEIPDSKTNASFFKKYDTKLQQLKKTIADANLVLKAVENIQKELTAEHTALRKKSEGLKDEFTKTEREISKALSDDGITAIKSDADVKLTG
jgi:hypothetical protein